MATTVTDPMKPDPAAIPVVKMPPLISEYTDYRKYLKDMYEYRKRNESTGMRAYSYSHFSAAADIKSPNYLKLIIEGKRNLSDDMIGRFARALRLEKQRAEEFKALVLYGQADEPVERNKYLKMLKLCKIGNSSTIS